MVLNFSSHNIVGVDIVGTMRGIPEHIQRLQVSHFYKADPQYGLGVAAGLGIEIPELLAKAGD